MRALTGICLSRQSQLQEENGCKVRGGRTITHPFLTLPQADCPLGSMLEASVSIQDRQTLVWT